MFVIAVTVMADDTVVSPDGRLNVCVNNKNGMPVYSVSYDGKFVLTESRLGLVANYADFSKNLKLKDVQREDNVVKDYYMINTKQNKFHYVSNKMDLIFENKDGHCMTVAFCVANNSVAFRYELQKPNNEKGIPLSAVILKETTSFRLAEAATSFLCQQSLQWLVLLEQNHLTRKPTKQMFLWHSANQTVSKDSHSLACFASRMEISTIGRW